MLLQNPDKSHQIGNWYELTRWYSWRILVVVAMRSDLQENQSACCSTKLYYIILYKKTVIPTCTLHQIGIWWPASGSFPNSKKLPNQIEKSSWNLGRGSTRPTFRKRGRSRETTDVLKNTQNSPPPPSPLANSQTLTEVIGEWLLRSRVPIVFTRYIEDVIANWSTL